MFSEFLLILSIILLIAFWFDSGKSYEIAFAYAKRICQKNQLSFLDDSVSLQKVRIKKDPRGNFRLFRRYGFEFSSDGSQRYKGSINMIGHKLIDFHMDAYRMMDDEQDS